MAPSNVLLLFFFWLLAAAFCVTYLAVTTRPVPTGLSVSSRQDDLQRSRDRPLRSWGPYLPRRVPNGKVPETTIAKAPPLGPERPTLKSFEELKQRTLDVAGAERKVPYSSERNRAARGESPASTESALVGAEDERLEPPFKRSAARAGKSNPTVKLSGTKKKVVAEQAPRKSRFARDRGGRGLGIFALSGDFGRPKGY
jgi:hypothetical protein